MPNELVAAHLGAGPGANRPDSYPATDVRLAALRTARCGLNVTYGYIRTSTFFFVQLSGFIEALP